MLVNINLAKCSSGGPVFCSVPLDSGSLSLVCTRSSHVHVTCQRIRSSVTERNLRHGWFYFPFGTRKMVHTLRASEAKDILFLKVPVQCQFFSNGYAHEQQNI